MNREALDPISVSKILLKSFSVFLLTGWVPGAYAATVCQSGPIPPVFTATAPSGNYTISPDAPIGTQLTPWTAWQGGRVVWVCASPKDVYSSVKVETVAGGVRIATLGRTYIAFPTSLPGVGVMGEQSPIIGSSMREGDHVAPLWDTWDSPVAVVESGYRPDLQVGLYTRYALVKTGAMGSGVAVASGPVARAGVEQLYDIAYIGEIHITGSSTFTVPTCAVPDVTVDLGRHMESDFPSIGSQRGYSGLYSDFKIDLTSCFVHTTSLFYSLQPLNGPVGGMPGMMNLAATSTAQGVGIRIADINGTPVAFNSKVPLNLSGGARYLPLRASIERIGSSPFAAGSVQGQVEFTISYN